MTENTERLTPAEEAYFANEGAEAPLNDGAGQPAPEQQAEAPEPDEIEADAGEDNSPNDGRPKTVPHAALHKERERRKALEAELQQMRDFKARLEERQRMVAEMQATQQRPPQPEPPRIPDPEEDIFGAVKATQAQLQQFQRQQAMQAAQAAEMQRQNAIVEQYRQEARARVSQEPEFLDAYKHLIESRRQELAALGTIPPQFIEQRVMADEFAIVQEAMRNRRRPTDVVMEWAKARGWRQDRAAASPTAGSDLSRISDAQRASKSLSGTGGSPTGPMTVERLVNMSEKEFATYAAKNPATVERLLGNS